LHKNGRPYALLSEVKEGDTLLADNLREYRVYKDMYNRLYLRGSYNNYFINSYVDTDNDQAMPFLNSFLKI